MKYEQPEPTSEEDEDDHDINELNKRIERQESTISNMLSSSGKRNCDNIVENFTFMDRVRYFVYKIALFPKLLIADCYIMPHIFL